MWTSKGVWFPPLFDPSIGAYGGTRYMPPYFWLNALVGWFTGDLITSGKLVSLAAAVGLCTAVGSATWKMSTCRDRPSARAVLPAAVLASLGLFTKFTAGGGGQSFLRSVIKLPSILARDPALRVVAGLSTLVVVRDMWSRQSDAWIVYWWTSLGITLVILSDAGAEMNHAAEPAAVATVVAGRWLIQGGISAGGATPYRLILLAGFALALLGGLYPHVSYWSGFNPYSTFRRWCWTRICFQFSTGGAQ